MTSVKTLIKKLQKMDPGLPVVGFSIEIGKEPAQYGFSEIEIDYIHLKIKKDSESKCGRKNRPIYIESKKSDKKAISAVWVH